MITGLKWNRVLIDICTQRDYLAPGAILQVVNREPLVERLRQTFAWAAAAGLPVVSSVESHRPSEPLNEFPLHCIDGSPGQEKLPFTLLEPWTMVETDNYLSLPPNLRENYRQIIFRKRSRDILSNPTADRFLTGLVADAIILFGVGLERALRGLALGLLARGKSIAVISDACGYWSAADGDLALRQLAAKGVRLVTLAELMAEPPPARPRFRRPVPVTVENRHHPVTSRSRRRARTDVSER